MVLGELNEKAILIEEVREAVNEMKSSKPIGLDGFPVKCLKIAGICSVWVVIESVICNL